MRSLSRFRRRLAAGVLALLSASAILVPVADAIAEARSASAVAHVEQTGSEQCGVAHDHSLCQLCRVVRLVGSAPAPALAIVVRTAAAKPGTDVVVFAPTGPLFATHSSRAPPGRSIA